MGAPAFEFQKLFDDNHMHVFSSNYALYGDMSNRVMNLLSGFTPEMEIYSIDEAFLKFENIHGFDPVSYGNKIRTVVTKATGIPVSVGFAHTKALAKVANKIAKKFSSRTGGVYVIDCEEARIKALKWLKIGDVWGIGRRYSYKLERLEIDTAYKFTQQSDAWVRKNMSVVGLRLKKELEGISMLDLEQVQRKKNIATTRSFEANYKDFEVVRERVSTFAVTCAQKLRKQHSKSGAVMVFQHTNERRKDLVGHNSCIITYSLID